MPDDTLGMTFEQRRKARGLAPAEDIGTWKRKLVIGASLFVAIIGAATTAWVYYALTYVGTMRAEVCGGVIVLSPDFDARLQATAVAEGARISAGRELARFDDSERKAELAEAVARVDLRKNQHEVATARVESAKADLALARLRGREQIRRAQANLKSSEARLARLRKGARREDIEAAEARLASTKTVASLYELQLNQTKALSEKGIESELDVEIMRTRLATQRNQVREAQLELTKLKAGARPEEIEIAAQEVEARKADLALARSSEDELKRLQLELESCEAQLRQAKSELDAAEAAVGARRAALEKTIIRSPVSGTVVRIYYHRGEVVRKGEPFIEVADDSKGRWVEGFVAEEDANRIKRGQTADIEVGIDSGIYAAGTVERIGYAAPKNGGRFRQYSESGSYGRPAPIWVKVSLPELEPSPRPGTSASVLIHVK
jgi:multidrug resistance efflux pump